MARVVYEGDLGGGHLFAGTKFFILQRVPTRNTWVDLIQSNGGEVVKIEKNADYVIADHVKKDCPPGSLSWKWIDACVKNGKLEDIEDYRAGPAQGSVREVGSAQPPRKGRTPFTDEDDIFLMKWVSRVEQNGGQTRGLELYKQLEERNPRHTFQSWRDRWIHYVSKRSRPEAADEDEEDLEDHLPPRPKRGMGPRIVSRGGSKVASHSGGLPISKSQPVKRTRQREDGAQSLSLPQTPWQTGNSFTKVENAKLLDEADSILGLDKDQAIDAWIFWATKYPTHSPQEWRNHFKHVIIPMLAEKENDNDDEEEEQQEEGDNAFKKIMAEVKDQEDKSAKQLSKHASPSLSSEITSPEKEHSKSLEIRDSQGSSGKTSSSQSASHQAVDPTTIDEQLFEHSLNILADTLGLKIEFERHICGRKIKLFRLWQVVLSDECGGFDNVNGRRLWPKVARKLNFSEFRNSTAAADLQACYSEILADLEECRTEYRQENPDLTESQERGLLDEQLLGTSIRASQRYEVQEDSGARGGEEEENEENEDPDDPCLTPTQNPPSPSAKRAIDVDRTPISSVSSKRQKIDNGKGRAVEEVKRTITSTPEGIINGTNSAKSYGSYPPKAANSQKGSDEVPEEQPLFVSPTRQPNPAAGKVQSHLEPKTQDFQFEIQDRSSAAHPSSSPQQARSCSDATDQGPGDKIADDSSTQSLTESEKNEALQVFMERMEALGYDEGDIAKALHATSLSETNAAEVLESLKQGRGIPVNIRGVWTEEDNEALGGGQNSRAYKKILAKHGVERIKERRKLLEGMEESE